nr:hypothetical protein [Tanacetum cinerariifolium]
MSKKSKGKEVESTGNITLRWSSDEEALLAECYVAVSDDRNVGRSQAKDTFWTSSPGKQRPGKKIKSDTSASTGGSQSSQFGEFVSHELRLKREAAEKAFEASKDKDETIKSLEELRFLALSTKDLSEDDAFWIERKKAQIKAKLRTEMPMEPNNEDDSNE